MDRPGFKFPELVYGLSFLLYLFSSSLTHIENGAEISLWLMSFAVITAAGTTVLPLFGVRWLRLNTQGWQVGRWLALSLQLASWGSFGWAMFQRLQRQIPAFHAWIMVTTLFWAAWMLIFIYSRHANQSYKASDTIKSETQAEHPEERG